MIISSLMSSEKNLFLNIVSPSSNYQFNKIEMFQTTHFKELKIQKHCVSD